MRAERGARPVHERHEIVELEPTQELEVEPVREVLPARDRDEHRRVRIGFDARERAVEVAHERVVEGVQPVAEPEDPDTVHRFDLHAHLTPRRRDGSVYSTPAGDTGGKGMLVGWNRSSSRR